MKKTEKEMLEIKRQNVFITEKLMLEGKYTNDDINRQFSGIMHLNNINTFAWDWLPEDFIARYEVDLEEQKTWSLEDFAEKHVHPITIEKIGPVYFNAIKNKNGDAIETFEYIRMNEKTNYEWVHKVTVFSFELEKVISISHLVRGFEKELSKEEKLLGEYDFVRKNFNKFLCLTPQQKEVLKLLATGQTNEMIASELQISPNTVRTHRNNLHTALDLRWKNINHMQVYMKYAHYFGLL